MTTVSECFSALVVSNRGQKCNLIKTEMKDVLMSFDNNSGLALSIIYKYHKLDMPEMHSKISVIVAGIMNTKFNPSDSKLFKNKKAFINTDKRVLDGNNDCDVSEFRGMLETYMSKGRWSGFVPLS
jgi:hypothetical protein